MGGVPLQDAEPEALARATALVFQETFLFADTVRENLTLGADGAPTRTCGPRSTSPGPAPSCERLPGGLDEVVGERGVTLSGGQRQRLALARGLLRRPRLLLLDDATSAVDARVEQAILAGLRGSTVATTLVVAHRVSTIALADRVLLLDDGRIVGRGHPPVAPRRARLRRPGAGLRAGRRVSAPPAPTHATTGPRRGDARRRRPRRRRRRVLDHRPTRAAATTSARTARPRPRRTPWPTPARSRCCAAAWPSPPSCARASP